jgi:hypothetical protein
MGQGDPPQPCIEVEMEAIPEWEFDVQYVYLGNWQGVRR